MTLTLTHVTPPNASETFHRARAKLTPEQIQYQKKIDDAIKRYLSNPTLKACDQNIPFTKKQLEEYQKCSKSAQYFIAHWVKIINLDVGLVSINLYPSQVEMIETCQNNRFVLLKAARQIGKSTTVCVGYVLWYVLFHSDKRVGILANKEATAMELLSRLRIAYQNLPLWLQQGVKEWNKGSIELENGSSVKASSTSSSAIRGWSINCLVLDEFAHVPPNVADEFFSSVYPTISSGQTTQIIITSTPCGLNLFYKLCQDSKTGKNKFVLREFDWHAVPWRDTDWEKNERSVLGDEKFEQEHEANFLGSQGTLISGKVLRTLAYREPVKLAAENKLKIYEEPRKGTPYLLLFDTSYGKELDYSAFIIYDLSATPYRMVATYKCNDIAHQLYPDVIKSAATYYNDAWIFGENNDVGAQVFHILQMDLEYENLLFTQQQKGKIVLQNTGDTAGLKSTPRTKRQGCMALKTLVENYQLIVDDFHCIEELSSFIAKKNKTYEADEGRHDDLCTAMWQFAWLTTQSYFKDLTSDDMRKKLFEQRAKQLDEEMPPAPIIAPALVAPKPNQEVFDGAVWTDVTQDFLGRQTDLAFGGRWTGYA